ncbi:hypothetical protein [Senegalia massiliensis]|uniref:Uncharacterized protein n=1 Tax=Senegalia massiliensis TaxID=1720316 RepID=A0A845QYH2_9CLOT|nr:hypothetical protein [Senegalia massiliensis]NBI07525.1 hypothetical protein [Senegalia massiliensis]
MDKEKIDIIQEKLQISNIDNIKKTKQYNKMKKIMVNEFILFIPIIFILLFYFKIEPLLVGWILIINIAVFNFIELKERYYSVGNMLNKNFSYNNIQSKLLSTNKKDINLEKKVKRLKIEKSIFIIFYILFSLLSISIFIAAITNEVNIYMISFSIWLIALNVFHYKNVRRRLKHYEVLTILKNK